MPLQQNVAKSRKQLAKMHNTKHTKQNKENMATDSVIQFHEQYHIRRPSSRSSAQGQCSICATVLTFYSGMSNLCDDMLLLISRNAKKASDQDEERWEALQSNTKKQTEDVVTKKSEIFGCDKGHRATMLQTINTADNRHAVRQVFWEISYCNRQRMWDWIRPARCME